MIRRLCIALCLPVVASACSVGAGAHIGGSIPDPQLSWGGHVAGATHLPDRFDLLHLGWDVEARAVRNAGTQWTGGLQLGVASTPAPRLGAVGGGVHFEAGLPIGWDTDGFDGYVGVRAYLAFSTSHDHGHHDRNRTYRLAYGRADIVPFVRWRAYFPTSLERWNDFAAGVALRYRLATDLL